MTRLFRSENGLLIPDGGGPASAPEWVARQASALQQGGSPAKPCPGAALAPEWFREACAGVRSMLLGKEKPFPCYFGTIAEGKNLLRYAYAEEDEMDAPFAFRDALVRYLGFCDSLPGRTVLVALLGASPEGWDEARYEARFWRTLQFLRDNDPEPWPEAYPADPENPAWEFCFAGRPLFISGHSPCHRRRRTRHFASGLGMVVQTRKNMEGLVGDAPAAAGVRAKIRGLIERYDDLPPSPRLGSYGDPQTLEWKQYWLPDDDSVEPPARCPLTIRR